MTRSFFLASALLAVTVSAAPPALALAPLDTVPRHELGEAATAHALREHPSTERPYRYAVPVRTALSLADGRWETDGADAVWRLRLSSRGALTLSLHVKALRLPAGASLQVIDAASGMRQKPYTADGITGAQAWLPLVFGPDLVLEARMPLAAKPQFTLAIDEAYHGYRDWKRAATGKAGSGACNINVACSQGDDWRREIRSVARLTFAGQYYCSGELLNNVRQDARALLITADHCGIGFAEGDVGAPSSVNTYFDYESSTCEGSLINTTPQVSTYGATLLADDVQADFTLLRLNTNGNSALPTDAYFAGWSALGEGSANGVSIHHPQGDEKKISVYSMAVEPSAADIGRACPVDAWQVRWSEGTTEPGSSGGGLWNSTHHLIGTLSGGNASCENADGTDYFARFDRGWTADPNRAHQLKAHLDPDGTCIAEIPGLDPLQQPNASPLTNGPTRCEGPASNCDGAGMTGGAWFAPGLLLALLARRRRANR